MQNKITTKTSHNREQQKLQKQHKQRKTTKRRITKNENQLEISKTAISGNKTSTRIIIQINNK